MKTFKILLGTIAFLAFSLFANAQEEGQPIYYVISYMKVKPGMHDEYLKLEKAWKKIHTARIKAGTLDGWFLERVVSPYGSSAEYNYVTVNRLDGRKNISGYFENSPFPEDLESLLTYEEMDLVKRTSEIREMVKTEVVRYRMGAFKERNTLPKVTVVNYMKLNDGYTGADYGKLEGDYWKPIHQARVDEGKMNGWGVYSLSMPYGKNTAYDAMAVDFYDNMEQYWTPYFNDYFKKIHPDKDADAIMKKMSACRDLTHSEVRMMIDSVTK